ncbi:MAG TPA: SDR family oxidoreductase [Ramlibacter sp.]|nr:SDR family oxidoreductase [Ramlibacter sp.]
MRFQDKVALVIGGNSGIGLAAAQAFAAEGAQVVITGRDAATLQSAAAAIGPDTLALQADVADLAATDRVMQAVRERHGRIDALLVNAGVGTFAPVREVTEALWDQVHGINLKGSFFAAQKALPLMGRGSAIVFTGSIGSVLALPGNSIYAAAKAGLRAAARILAAELVGEGIRVNVVSPGPTETPILRRNVGMSPEAEHALREQMIANTPMKRMGEPQEIAKAVLFLASSDASFITGVDLFVDGGVVEL